MPNLQKKFLLILIAAVLAVGGYFVATNKSLSKFDLLKLINPTPYQKLEKALDKTGALDTFYVDYKTKVSSRMTVQGLTENVVNNVDGYITGSTDDKTTKMEMRIYNEDTPSASVVIGLISVENGDLYIRGPATGVKWQKITKDEYKTMLKEDVPDASLYGFEMISTVFSENKALFKSVEKDAVRQLSDVTENDKAFAKYETEVSVVDFIEVLRQDKESELSEKNIKDRQTILQDAIIKTTYSVDKKSGYIAKLVIDAKNLTQVPTTPEAAQLVKQLGLSTQHDLTLTADFSRYNLPTGIVPPDKSEILNP